MATATYCPEDNKLRLYIGRLDVHLFSDSLEAQRLGLFSYNMDNAPDGIVDYVKALEKSANTWIDSKKQDPTLLTNRERTLSHDLYFYLFETLDDEPDIATTQEAGRIATELQKNFTSLLIELRTQGA